MVVKKKVFDKKVKEVRKAFSVGKDAVLTLKADGLRRLLSMGLGRTAENFIYQNVGSKQEDRLKRFRLNAEMLVKNAEANRIGNINQATPQELKMKLILKELGVQYEYQRIYYTGMTYYIVDFYLPELNIVLELDGSQHQNKDDREYDALRTENLTFIHKVLKVIRFDNKELEVDTDIKNKLSKQLNLK